MFQVNLPVSHQSLKLSYDRHGSGPIKILFISGLRTEGRTWKPQVEFFNKHQDYECVTFDNRGCGRSSSPLTLEYTTAQMAKDALALIDHLSWSRCHVVGISMGGMISMEFALLAPDRVLSLTLMVTHAGGLMGQAPMIGMRHILRTFFIKEEHEILKNFLEMLYSSKTLNDPNRHDFFYNFHRNQLKTSSPMTMIGTFGQMFAIHRHYVSYNDLLKIRYSSFPSLILVASEDRLVREKNSFMLRETLAGRLVQFENSAHDLAAECADQVNEELFKFIKSTSNESREQSMIDETHQELKALGLCCQHRTHCLIYDFVGFVKGYVFGWVIYLVLTGKIFNDENYRTSFILAVGCLNGLRRSIFCIINGVRSRRFGQEKNLFIKRRERLITDRIIDAERKRTGIPDGSGLEFPMLPILLSVVFFLILFSIRGITISSQLVLNEL